MSIGVDEGGNEPALGLGPEGGRFARELYGQYLKQVLKRRPSSKAAKRVAEAAE